jgi:hypothetical protein
MAFQLPHSPEAVVAALPQLVKMAAHLHQIRLETAVLALLHLFLGHL